MQRFIAQITSVVAIVVFATTISIAQNRIETYCFREFTDLFKQNIIEIPINTDYLLKLDYSQRPVVDCELYNYIVITSQKERAMRMTISGNKFKVTKYGYAECEGLTVNNGVFYEKTYALGQIVNEKYNIFIVRIESVRNSYIDMYVFDKDGRITSFLDLYENERYIKDGVQYIESVFINSSISNQLVFNYEENRYSVNVKIDYQLQDDGILKEINKTVVGQYEVVDKDGYVNVREKPDGKSKILYTIESGSVVNAVSQDGSRWYKIISIEDDTKTGGYVHSSRLADYW